MKPKNFLLMLMLAASMFVPGRVAAQTGQQLWAADVPMYECDGVPCIDATAGSAPMGRAIIDTGNIVSVVDTADGPAVGFGPDNMQNGRIVRAAHTDIGIGKLRIENVAVLALPLNEMIRQKQVPTARTTLAYSAFRGHVLQLDFKARRVRISAAGASCVPCTAPFRALHLQPFGKGGPNILVADGFALGNQPITAQIDTVYTGGLLIYTASIAKLGLQATSNLAAQTEHFAFTDGGVDMRKTTAPSLTFAANTLATNAPLYFPTPGVHEPDEAMDGTVGLALMRGKVVTIDLNAMTFSIAPD